MRIDADALESFRADETRTLYVFDVRDPTEYAAGHFPGAVSAPGGQLVQATDQYAGTLGARIVLVDDREVRARDDGVVAASRWAGATCSCWPRAGAENGPAGRAGARPGAAAGARHRGAGIVRSGGAGPRTVVDLSLSPAYRKGHIPGAWFAIRTRLAQALAKIPMNGDTGPDFGGRRARRPRGEPKPVRRPATCAAAMPPGQAAGLPLSTEPRMADEPLDYLAQALRAHRRHQGRA